MFILTLTNIATVMLLVVTFLSCGMDLFNNIKFEGDGLTRGSIWLLTLSVALLVALNTIDVLAPAM